MLPSSRPARCEASRRRRASSIRIAWSARSGEFARHDARARLDVIHEPHERIESDHVLRVGHEVRQRVYVVVVRLAVAVVDQVLDAADVETDPFSNPLDTFNYFLRRRVSLHAHAVLLGVRRAEGALEFASVDG